LTSLNHNLEQKEIQLTQAQTNLPTQLEQQSKKLLIKKLKERLGENYIN